MASEYDRDLQSEKAPENPATGAPRNAEDAKQSADPVVKPNGSSAQNGMQNSGEATAHAGAPGTQVSKPNGKTAESVHIAGQNTLGGGIFDPARWKTSADARLDPRAKIQPASHSKVEVRKPPADHYVRVHPDPAFNGVFPLYSDSMAKRYDPYLIAPELTDSLPPQVKVNIKSVRLAVATTDSGRSFLWFIAQTGSDWHESGDQCILTAMTQWIKVLPDGSGYRQEYPEVDLPEPVFPDLSFAEYLARAFKDRYIDDFAHPVIKRLAGIR
jgi:hypothetical protein